MNRRGKYARLPLLIGALLLLTLIPFALFRGSQAPEAEAAWWDNSWRYRKPIQVTNNTTQQTNVYITLTLDTSDTTKFQDDCGDLRFTKQNGQVLPYYIASGCGTASTSVHVQLDTFPAGAQTLYAYYGNPSAPNGFANNDFLMEATNYTVGGTGSEEIAPGPVAYWKFDEGSGSTAHDSAGSNNGNINGATWVSEDQCIDGKCLNFDGLDDSVSATNPSNFCTLPSISYVAWVNSDLATQNNSSGIIVNRQFKLTAGSDYSSRIYLEDGSDATVLKQVSTGIPLNQNEWDFVATTFDLAEGKIHIYLNGNLMASESFDSAGLTLNDDYCTALVLGNDYDSSNRKFDGYLDEVKIFPYALTEDEIKAEYNLGAAAVIGTGPAAPPPLGGNLDDSLVAHWAFDEQSGQTAHDKVGTNHGTLGADTNPGSDDPTWKSVSECKVNGCLGFDGTNNFITNSSPENLPTGSQATWTWWSKSSATGWSANALLGDNRSLWSIRQSSNYLYLGLGGEESGATASFSTDVNWSHYAITFNSGSASFFKNGEMIGNYSFANTTVPALSTLYVGRRSTVAAPYFFNGLIDEVKIYNTALTPEQVLQDMNAGASLTVGVGADEADEIIDGAGAPPIAEWKFDENQGTTAYDTSGNGNDGTVNGATWKSGCQQGACLEFDGNNRISISNDPILSPNQVTVGVWARLSPSFNSWGYLVAKEWGYSGYALYVAADRRPVFITNDGSSPQNINYGSTNLEKGKWYYLVGTYDGTKSTIYVDGVSENVQSFDMVQSSSTLFLGNHGDNTRGFNGQIDHIKIYDYARTPAQIAYDYNRGAPVAHWRFDECEGTVAHDSSGNGNHGTINIGPSGSQSTAGTCQTSGAWANGKDGKFNGSLNFDGTDDVVNLGNPSRIANLSTNITAAVWIKPTSGGGVLYRGAGSNYNYLLQIESSSQIRLRLWETLGDAGSGINYLVPGLNLFNSWNHIAFTYDGNSVKIFVNAELKSNTPRSAPIATGETTQLGEYPGGGPRYLTGQIDDVRIYNYALSPAQILKVYNQGQAVNFTRAN